MSPYLIDSSAAWRIRRGETLARSWDERLVQGEVRSCAPQRVEFLASARNADEFEHDSAVLLETFPDVAVPQTAWRWIDSTQLRLSRSGGALRAFSVVDLLICATAAHHGLTILHDDNDFATAARLLPDVSEHRIGR